MLRPATGRVLTPIYFIFPFKKAAKPLIVLSTDTSASDRFTPYFFSAAAATAGRSMESIPWEQGYVVLQVFDDLVVNPTSFIKPMISSAPTAMMLSSLVVHTHTDPFLHRRSCAPGSNRQTGPSLFPRPRPIAVDLPSPRRTRGPVRDGTWGSGILRTLAGDFLTKIELHRTHVLGKPL